MQKLIELLNEYDGKNHWRDYDEEYLTSEEFYGENGDLEIISKKFGFIKWLVENEKIDLGKIKKLYRKSNEHSINTYPVMLEYSDLESLLMLLSIQDEPINFLISILKNVEKSD